MEVLGARTKLAVSMHATRVRAWSFGIALGALSPTISSPSLANGRFPESNQIVFSADDPDLVVLRVTFGLLISHDRGHTFDWVCEQSIGYSGIEDPMYTVTPSKALIASTFQGVTVTRDQACNWSFAPGEVGNQVFIDLAARPGNSRDVVVFASSYDRQDEAGAVLFKNKVWQTTDEAQSFQPLGGPLDPTLLGYTIDQTATDPDRLYITAVRNAGISPKGYLLTSKNRGQTWEEMDVPLKEGERAVFIAAVDPTNAERVYLRTSSPTPDKPTRLLLREAGPDGGTATVRELYSALGGLLGFAVTPDGSKVYIGGPKDGLKVASTTDFAFQQRAPFEVQCLALNPDGLWACSNETQGFVAGLSTDDGVTFEPRLRFCSVRGPLACQPGSTTADRCNALWPQQRSLLGCEADAGASDAGSADAGTQSATSSKGGCGCNTIPAGPWGGLVTALGAGVAFLRRARKRDRVQ